VEAILRALYAASHASSGRASLGDHAAAAMLSLCVAGTIIAICGSGKDDCRFHHRSKHYRAYDHAVMTCAWPRCSRRMLIRSIQPESSTRRHLPPSDSYWTPDPKVCARAIPGKAAFESFQAAMTEFFRRRILLIGYNAALCPTTPPPGHSSIPRYCANTTTGGAEFCLVTRNRASPAHGGHSKWQIFEW